MAAVEVAAAVIQRADGAFLLARRPAGKAYAGYWEFPGGKVEAGETIEFALQREMREEVGIEVCIEALLHRVDHVYAHGAVSLHAYLCRCVGGEPRPLQVAQVEWVTLAQLKQRRFPEANAVLIEALERWLMSKG